MTEYICACDAICVEEKHGRVTTASPQSAIIIWNDLRRLIGTIGMAIIEIYRWNNEVQPQFLNGGMRVLIRPDRIDLA